MGTLPQPGRSSNRKQILRRPLGYGGQEGELVMARSLKYDDRELAEIKRSVPILEVCAVHHIILSPHGTNDKKGLCPFHKEKKPSFIVTPGKNLWHCMGCGKGGSVIDLVMQLENLTFTETIEKLRITTRHINRIRKTDSKTKQLKKKSVSEEPEPSATIPVGRAAALLERTLAVYEKNFTESDEGKAYLESRGITDAALFTKHRIGYSNGRLSEMLSGSGSTRGELNTIGILLDPVTPGGSAKRERFSGCVVFPVFDEEGQLTTIYGRKIPPTSDRRLPSSGAKHLYLPNRSTGLWNAPAIKTHTEIILTESVIDALSVMVAGFPNAVAVQGTNGLKDSDIESIERNGVTSIILLLDGDKAGGTAAAKLRPKLEAAGLAVSVKALPQKHDPNSYLQEHGAEELKRFLLSDAPKQVRGSSSRTPSELENVAGAKPAESEAAKPVHHSRCGSGDGGQVEESSTSAASPGTPSGSQTLPSEISNLKSAEGGFLSFTYGLRTYSITGLEKAARKLRATVRVEYAGKLHVDTLDFYSSRSRRTLAQDLCRIFSEAPETIEADITRLMQACEKAEEKQRSEISSQKSETPVISAAETKEAEVFGKSPDLIEKILADFETCGLVGEEPNKLLAYLAATSRKTDEPLSLLVLSSSGAGKTALQDTALQFVPPEDLVKLTSLSGKALFYKERYALKHKVLSLEEGDGAQEATYAIRNLISAGELIIESTIKDLGSGRLTTMENRVEGPTSVFITTTDPDTDPETKSRFFVTSIDEGRAQTRAILDFQRKRQTLDGLVGNMAADAILKKHRNFQRLLKPVAVVNPFADQLAYGDDRLQGRRDQPKYLKLIKAAAFLRQMLKEVKRFKVRGSKAGEVREYVLVDVEDVRIANRLAHEILGRSLDELSRPGRSLLLQLDDMVEKKVEQLKEAAADKTGGSPDQEPDRTGISFTRREIREHSGWAHTRVHRYIKELLELEYVLIDSGRNGTLCRYRLAYEGQGKDGSRFMLGLTDPDNLKAAK